MKIDLIFYLLKSIAGIAVVFFTAKEFAVHEFWVVPLSVFLLSIPISLGGMYGITIRQTHRISLFVQQGWIYRLFLGRTLKTLLWILWSLLGSFYMLIQFQFYQLEDWVVFLLLIPVFYLTYTLFRHIFAHEIKPYLVTNMALIWAGWCAPALMLIIYIAYLFNFSDMPIYSNLSMAITEQKIAVADMTSSALVWHALQFFADFEAIKAYAFGSMSLINKHWAILGLGIGSFVVFYNACKMLSCLLIPKQEYLRIVAPLTDAEQPVAVTKSGVAVITAILTFVILFIYLPLFAGLESEAKQSSELRVFREDVEQKIVQIDGVFYRQELLADLQQAKLKALHNAELSLVYLEGQVDRAFDRLESNVDIYLDWYYSLGGEYARIGHLMAGDFNHYMTQKLQASLQQGDAFKQVQVALDKTLESHKQAIEEYQLATRKILTENRIDHIVTKAQIVQQLSLEDIFKAPQHEDMIKMQYRLGGSGAAATVGAIGGVVVTKIIAKVAGKTTFKLAVKGVSKLAVSKVAGTAGGAGAGAATGAAIGSIIPGAGTVIGAVAGGIIGGIATGLVIDKALIELESYLNREQFKQAIISAINEAREEFKVDLKG